MGLLEVAKRSLARLPCPHPREFRSYAVDTFAAMGETGCRVETVVVRGHNRKEELCTLMAEFFRLEGCQDIRAEAPNFHPPEKIVGSVKDHSPSLTCRRSDKRGTAILLDTLLVEGGAVDIGEVVSRLQLFASAAQAINGELHLVVPQRVGGCDGEELVRALLRRLGLHAHRIWSL